MIKPYYQDEWVTIYNGDCREILPELPKVDLVLTDPPYINLKGGLCRNIGTNNPKNISVGNLWDAEVDWVKEAWGKAISGMMIFCSFSNVMPIGTQITNDNVIGLVTWLKRNSSPPIRNVPYYNTEFIWLFKKEAGLNWHNLPVFFDIPTLNHVCYERIKGLDGIAEHPTQKPLELIKSLLSVHPDDVLDPFMGSGTTLRACKELGIKSIGIEISEKYCEIAAKRCMQTVMNFEPVKEKPKQGVLMS